MVTTFANIADIVMKAGQLFTDEVSIMLPHHQNNAFKRISQDLHSIERADASLQRPG
jgi:hypothetical protein